jgi:3-hydroxymyristoyl/3-hydroxydecanoyl-(acyl carrier protein) dehydratase
MVHAGGAISSIFGPKFAAQDAYRRQCRMPLPPLLLADRMTGLAAEPASMGKGVVWTETDVTEESWYLNRGRMPTGILIESGQADLLLISYLGCDLLNRDERLYRLLGCEMTITGDLPRPGETLRYEIHVDGHARQGAVRLFFFHYDCHVDGVLRIQVRGGQAGFFTEEELATSAGILWTPEEGAARLSATARLDPPAVEGAPSAYTADAVAAFAAGRPWDCFGPAWRWTMTHLDTPRIQDGRMLFLGEVTHFEPRGGPWGRGYLRATTPVTPQDWFFEGHFLNDPCMPGTLMFEASVQTLSFFMAAMGFTLRRDGWRFQPVQNEAVKMRCRGQVTPQSKQLVYEIFVSEVHAGPTPRVWADLLCTVDGLKAFHAERFGLELVPGWPGAPLLPGDPRALRTEEGLLLDKNALLASAVGRPSLAFGPGYARFDAGRHAPRLPGPPYHFISRVVSVSAPFGAMAPNTTVVVELDLPAEPLSPAEQMEAALQPCGWLASWSGCTLSSPTDLFFRNLDGKGQQHRLLQPGDRRLTTQATLRKMARTAGMIIVHFEVACSVDGAPLWEMETSFGFFPAAALASQAGLTAPPAERDWIAAPGEVEPVTSRGRLWMIDRVTGRWPTGGAAGLGRIRGEKDVSPDAWYFKAHFYDDPVQPGSLGVEALMQLLGLLVEAQRPGATLRLGAPGVSLGWRYRGQVLPLDQRVTLLVEVTAWRAEGRAERVEAEGSLWVDGKRIYALTGLSLLVEPA